MYTSIFCGRMFFYSLETFEIKEVFSTPVTTEAILLAVYMCDNGPPLK